MKKIKALSILKDNLNIKLYNSLRSDATYPNKKVHFKDVLKGLLKRILEEKKLEYEIKGVLSRKIENMWEKRHKELKS